MASTRLRVSLRVAMLERATSWLEKNRKSDTWRIIDELSTELIRNPIQNVEQLRDEVRRELIAEGYRKVPGVLETAKTLNGSDPEGGAFSDPGEDTYAFWYPQAEAVIRLMERKK